MVVALDSYSQMLYGMVSILSLVGLETASMTLEMKIYILACSSFASGGFSI